MTLLILFGPPAVGKTTVGQLVAAKTDFRLFTNHMVMDGIMELFGVGSPAEDRLSRLIRESVIEQAAEAKLNLIFTYVWNFALDKGRQNIKRYKELYEARGGEVLFVELVAPLASRVERAKDPDRYLRKRHAAKAELLPELELVKSFTSPDPFYWPEQHHQIDTTDCSAEQVAGQIVELLEAPKKRYYEGNRVVQ